MRLTLLCILLAASCAASAKPGTDTDAFSNGAPAVATTENGGAKIYMERCALCHGSKGLGEGPLPLLIRDYPSTNLRKLLKEHTPDAITEAIVEGGSEKPVNRFSPPWKHEISESDIKLVSSFINLLRVDYTAAVEEIRNADVAMTSADGRKIYLARCQRCHGQTGEGDGPLKAILQPAPATDLTASVLTDEARMAIIRRGGAALGRSPQMPPWGQELTDAELRSLVGYLRTMRPENVQATRLD